MQDPANSVFTEILIEAPCPVVWDVLTDWPRLKEWSSSFVGISVDQLVQGTVFVAHFKHPLNREPLQFERMCTEYVEGRLFSWSGSLKLGALTDRHVFDVVDMGRNLTLFKQEDGIHGAHSGFMNLLARPHMEAMYHTFNKELKTRVELLYSL